MIRIKISNNTEFLSPQSFIWKQINKLLNGYVESYDRDYFYFNLPDFVFKNLTRIDDSAWEFNRDEGE